ncbi:uncharacterized protein LOC126561079 [Anopheles maculipalpis]|uniref:uncharacterized protein LOC126561079 n=1 Tax=Anopheles maculipalpis TaxID=1496333 RepID=UPI002158E96E|nr:uncharacterized protein LOC126561079 [Anopheles maculipalpis]
MKQTLLLSLFLVVAVSTAIASPRRIRMAKPDNSNPSVQNETVVQDQDTAPPSTGLSDQPVDTQPEESDPEPLKEVEEQKTEADPVVSNPEEHVIAETVVTDAEEEASAIPSADCTATVPEQTDMELAEDTHSHETESTDKKSSKSFLSLFLNGLGHIKSAIHDLQTRMETFFVSSEALEALGDIAKH